MKRLSSCHISHSQFAFQVFFVFLKKNLDFHFPTCGGGTGSLEVSTKQCAAVRMCLLLTREPPHIGFLVPALAMNTCQG